jgi:ribosome-associated protein
VIRIDDRLEISEDELVESFVRASGPGGQHVNKVSTAVQLRFDVAASPSLPDAVKARLARLAGRRLTLDGVLVLVAQEHRSQERNRVAAREALVALIRQAAVPPVPRRKTRPTYASKLKRLEGKSHRAGIKRGRTTRPDAE